MNDKPAWFVAHARSPLRGNDGGHERAAGNFGVIFVLPLLLVLLVSAPLWLDRVTMSRVTFVFVLIVKGEIKQTSVE